MKLKTLPIIGILILNVMQCKVLYNIEDGSSNGTDVNQSKIEVELTWNNQSDLDLQMNINEDKDCGNNIWFGNKSPIWNDNFPKESGPNGWLELDTVQGFGPEKLKVLEPENGRYYINVSNFGNFTEPTTANIKVYIGNTLVSEFSREMFLKNQIWRVGEFTVVDNSINFIPKNSDSDTETGTLEFYKGCYTGSIGTQTFTKTILNGEAESRKKIEVLQENSMTTVKIDHIQFDDACAHEYELSQQQEAEFWMAIENLEYCHLQLGANWKADCNLDGDSVLNYYSVNNTNSFEWYDDPSQACGKRQGDYIVNLCSESSFNYMNILPELNCEDFVPLEPTCESCLDEGGTWQPEFSTCTENCDIEDISCFTQECPGECTEITCGFCFNQNDCENVGCTYNIEAEATWCSESSLNNQ